jgi:hypothetical protein
VKRYTAHFDSTEALEQVQSALLKDGWVEELTIPRASGKDVVLRYRGLGMMQGAKFLLSWNK